MSEPVRLQRYLASGGVAARRKAEEMITAGRVTVNGKVVRVLGTKIDPDNDSIAVDGEPVVAHEFFYVLFNKPKACITAVSDDRGRPTVMDYLPNLPVPVRPVGRLDFYSEGVLLLTNDGDLAARLLAPASHVAKTYHVKVHGQITKEDLQALRGGVTIDDGSTTLPADVSVLPGESKYTWLAITIHEGKHRQIHRMLAARGYVVDKLQRVAFANLTFHNLRIGDARELTQLELNELRSLVGLDHSAVARGAWRVERELTDAPRRAKTKARLEAEEAANAPPVFESDDEGLEDEIDDDDDARAFRGDADDDDDAGDGRDSDDRHAARGQGPAAPRGRASSGRQVREPTGGRPPRSGSEARSRGPSGRPSDRVSGRAPGRGAGGDRGASAPRGRGGFDGGRDARGGRGSAPRGRGGFGGPGGRRDEGGGPPTGGRDGRRGLDQGRDARGPSQDARGPSRDARGPSRDVRGPSRDARGPSRDARGPSRDARGPSRDARGPSRDARGGREDRGAGRGPSSRAGSGGARAGAERGGYTRTSDARGPRDTFGGPTGPSYGTTKPRGSGGAGARPSRGPGDARRGARGPGDSPRPRTGRPGGGAKRSPRPR